MTPMLRWPSSRRSLLEIRFANPARSPRSSRNRVGRANSIVIVDSSTALVRLQQHRCYSRARAILLGECLSRACTRTVHSCNEGA